MKEKPILFKTPMVQAIQEGRKTQTRRVIEPQPIEKEKEFENQQIYFENPAYNKKGHKEYHHPVIDIQQLIYNYSPYRVGQKLWVRETWCNGKMEAAERGEGLQDEWYVSQCINENDIIYKEACISGDIGIEEVVWKPSRFMPKKYARIWLEITDVRVEKVNDISDEDANMEGFYGKCLIDKCPDCKPPFTGNCEEQPIQWFSELWDSINAKRGYSWESNPFVWCRSFKKSVKEEQ